MQLLVQNCLDPSRATEIFSVPKRRIFALPKIVRYRNKSGLQYTTTGMWTCLHMSAWMQVCIHAYHPIPPPPPPHTHTYPHTSILLVQFNVRWGSFWETSRIYFVFGYVCARMRACVCIYVCVCVCVCVRARVCLLTLKAGGGRCPHGLSHSNQRAWRNARLRLL